MTMPSAIKLCTTTMFKSVLKVLWRFFRYVFKTIRQVVERTKLAIGLMIRIVEAVESYQRRCGLTSGPQFVRFILQLENSLFFYSIKLHKRNYLTFLFCLLSWIQNSNHYDNQEREDVVHKENSW